MRAGPDGEFVHLEGAAQPAVCPSRAEARGGLRIAAARGEGREGGPPAGEADHVSACHGHRGGETRTPGVTGEPLGELVLVPGRCAEGVGVERAQRADVGEDVSAVHGRLYFALPKGKKIRTVAVPSVAEELKRHKTGSGRPL